MSVGYIRGVGIVIIGFILLNHFVFHNVLHIPLCQWNLAGCHYASGVYQIVPLQILGIFLTFIGLVIAVTARKTLAGNWSSTLDVKEEHKLITTGIYQYMRHPIYTGVLLMLLGTLCAFLSFNEFIIFFCATLLFIFRMRQEEALMTKTFPKDYPAYKKRTKRLIPFIW